MEYYQDMQFQSVMQLTAPYPKNTFHPEANSLEFLSSGKVMLEHNGIVMKLEAPVLFWMKEGEQYSFIKSRHTAEPFVHFSCNYTGERSCRITESLQKICPEGYLHPGNPSAVAKCFLDMIGYHRINRELYHGEMVLCVEQIVLEIERTLRKDPALEETPYHLKEIADEIRRTPFQNFDFRQIARREGVSYSQFRRLFHSFYNMPVVEYVHSQRMLRITEMLTMTSMRLKDIAFSCSFASQKDFSRFVKVNSGMSPREYRMKHSDLCRSGSR